jgi:hypothetical protein
VLLRAGPSYPQRGSFFPRPGVLDNPSLRKALLKWLRR